MDESQLKVNAAKAFELKPTPQTKKKFRQRDPKLTPKEQDKQYRIMSGYEKIFKLVERALCQTHK